LKNWQLWTLNIVASLVLILVVFNMFLFSGNRSLRAEVSNRQLFINQSVQLNHLNNNIIRSLAEIAASKNDAQLKTLLNDNGITFQISPPVIDSAQKETK